MNQWIRESVGKNAVNDPTDVEVVENLLLEAGAYSPMLPSIEPVSPMEVDQNPLCVQHLSGDFIQAIEDFQSLWGFVDGRVDRDGATIRRLGQITTGPILSPISMDRITRGGYKISYIGETLPFPYRQLLGVSRSAYAFPDGSQLVDESKFCIDLTGRNPNDLIDVDNLPHLLDLFRRWSSWGLELSCKILVVRSGSIISSSNSEAIKCPVQPYEGELKSPSTAVKLGIGDNGPRFTYTGIQTGRMLHHKKIDGKYFFKYGGLFETSNLMRGFNCITYIGAVFAVDSASRAMSYRGGELAKYLKAEKCGMESKKSAEIKEFFAENPKGMYLMWSMGHVVLVIDGVVHEFSQSKGGYASTKAANWGYGIHFYTIRKLKLNT